jgi:hypothetical protein
VRWSTGAPSLPLLIFSRTHYFSPPLLRALSFSPSPFFLPVRWKILDKFCRPVPSKKTNLTPNFCKWVCEDGFVCCRWVADGFVCCGSRRERRETAFGGGSGGEYGGGWPVFKFERNNSVFCSHFDFLQFS